MFSAREQRKKVPDKTFQNQQESCYAQVQFFRGFTVDKSRKIMFSAREQRKKSRTKPFKMSRNHTTLKFNSLECLPLRNHKKTCFLLASGEKSSGQILSKSARIILRSSTILEIKRTIGPIATPRICPSLLRNLHDFTIHVLCSVFIMKTKSSLLNPQSVAH